jgi:PASTA domain
MSFAPRPRTRGSRAPPRCRPDRRVRRPGRRRLRCGGFALPGRDDGARRRSEPRVRPCRRRVLLLATLARRLDLDRESGRGGRPGVRQCPRVVGLAVRGRDGSRRRALGSRQARRCRRPSRLGDASVAEVQQHLPCEATDAAGPPRDLLGAAVGLSSDGTTALVSSARGSFIFTQAGSRGGTDCYVPYLEGKKLRAAKRIIESTHCRVGKVTRVSASRRQSDRVISESPESGERLARGGKIYLRVG